MHPVNATAAPFQAWRSLHR